ncbi:lysophospholipid acyltransferase family protein [Gallicola sp. Sow4_E12]|uniref:lysophospholipid acyltransferase family protein n=1 Tax=Gallicola sp. Sow4_E12 TaxID=3438785 RepID=UPI003F9111CF
MNKIFYWIVRNILYIVFHIVYRIEIIGDNDQGTGAIMICSNHTSDLDPIILAIAYKKPIHFMAKKELFKNPVFGWLIEKAGAFPVDRGNVDLKSVKHAMGLLKSERVLGIFPEGTRVKTVDIANMKEGVSLIAAKSGADIQPVLIETNYKLFKKVRVHFRPIIKMEQFNDIPKKEKGKIITNNLFASIYNSKELE